MQVFLNLLGHLDITGFLKKVQVFIGELRTYLSFGWLLHSQIQEPAPKNVWVSK